MNPWLLVSIHVDRRLIRILQHTVPQLKLSRSRTGHLHHVGFRYAIVWTLTTQPPIPDNRIVQDIRRIRILYRSPVARGGRRPRIIPIRIAPNGIVTAAGEYDLLTGTA